MVESYKLSYDGYLLENQVAGSALALSADFPTGTYTKTLFYNSGAAETGTFSDSIYNYDLLRITTMPQDPVTNKLAAPNVPFYVEPEWLRNNTVHTQTFGFDNASAITTTGYFIWADNGFSASPDGMSFTTYKHGPNFRIGGTRWNNSGLPANGGSGSYLNYYKSIYQVDGIIYNGNRELLYSGNTSTVSANLSKSITGNGYKLIQIKVSVNNYTTDYDGVYVHQVNAERWNVRDSLTWPYGGTGNWYNAGAMYGWANNYSTLVCSGAKAFQKSLTTTAGMTGNTSTPRSNIFAVWGVK